MFSKKLVASQEDEDTESTTSEEGISKALTNNTLVES